jgi:DNA-binding CsgD family transcriptional regulator
MQQCHFCRKPLQSGGDIFSWCPPCRRMYLGRVVWPEVRALLQQCTPRDADNKAYIQNARTALYDKALPEMDNAPLDHTRPLAQVVKQYVEIWRIFERGRTQYATHATHAHPAVELVTHLGEAIYWRRVYRRYLRQRFGILVSSRGFDARSRSRQFRPGEIGDMTTAGEVYLFCEAKFYASLLNACAAQSCGADAQGIITAAVAGARCVLEALPSLVSQMIGSPLPWQRDEAILSMAGALRLRLRLYPSVRSALGQIGDPRAVLHERLPEFIWQAYCAGARGMSELLEAVGRLVGQVRRKQSKKSLHYTSEPMLERREAHRQRTQQTPSELDEWVAKQEELQRLGEGIQRAGLSPREAEFLSLSRSELSYSAIASQKGVVVGTVKTTMSRAYKKLRKIARS